MLKQKTTLLLLGIFFGCTSNQEEQPLPSMLTEFSEIHSNAQGALYKLHPDNRDTYYIENQQNGYIPYTTYRVACTYFWTTKDSSTVRLYNLERIEVLKNKTNATPSYKDPLDVVSVWQSDKYLNMHLSVKSQGGIHNWGFCIDSLKTETDGKQKLYISLYHHQNNDPMSYHERVYASIMKEDYTRILKHGDEVILKVNTFSGIKSWYFSY